MQDNQNSFDTKAATDIDLVHSAKQGNMGAFEELVRRHTKRVFGVAYHITHSHEEAEEVCQETFLKAYCHLKEFEHRAQFHTWLTRIAVNTAFTTVRRSNFFRTEHDEEPLSYPNDTTRDVPDWRPNPEQLYSRYQLEERLRQALGQLPKLYSTVFLLRDMQGLSVAETAAALQVSIPAVKTRLLRARLQLREVLSKSFARTGRGEEDHEPNGDSLVGHQSGSKDILALAKEWQMARSLPSAPNQHFRVADF